MQPIVTDSIERRQVSAADDSGRQAPTQRELYHLHTPNAQVAVGTGPVGLRGKHAVFQQHILYPNSES
jgi:hypothetical protein